MIITTEHDNADRDIIIINKDSLTLRLSQSKEFYNSQNSAFGFAGIAFAFLTAGYLTDTFHNVGFIPGETIRSVFIVLGIITFVLAGRSILKWYRLRNGHQPEEIVRSFLKPQATEDLPKKQKNKRRMLVLEK